LLVGAGVGDGDRIQLIDGLRDRGTEVTNHRGLEDREAVVRVSELRTNLVSIGNECAERTLEKVACLWQDPVLGASSNM
jgi:hypothetical protein